MKRWLSAEQPHRAMRYATLSALGLLLAAMLPAALAAAESPAPGGTAAEPIHITADRLVTDSNNRSAEFSGNVKAVQAQTVITTDRLKLTYSDGGGQDGIGSDSIDILEAIGQVRITFDNRVAVSEKAVYTAIDRKLVLTGPNSTITSGQDVIVGSQITFYRDEGRVEIVGDGQNRVKATIHSDQGGLN